MHATLQKIGLWYKSESPYALYACKMNPIWEHVVFPFLPPMYKSYT
jgi:hypothetical protein